MNQIASSASPNLVHWHDVQPEHLTLTSIMENVAQAANDALFEAKELFVTKEYETIQSIEKFFGIYPISHQIANKNLLGCKIVLLPHGQLEIYREWQKYATSFPVQFAA